MLWKLALAMVNSRFDFDRALAYALSCVKQEVLSLKDQQVEAVKLLSEGKDIFVWFPTGYRKSICYQLLPFVFDVKLGRTNASLVDRSVILVISALVSDSTRILFSVLFICIFIELYNCFTECYTVEFTIATDTPIYNQYQAVFFARHYIIGLGTRLRSVKIMRPTCAYSCLIKMHVTHSLLGLSKQLNWIVYMQATL